MTEEFHIHVPDADTEHVVKLKPILFSGINATTSNVRFELLTISGSDDRSRRGRRRQCVQRGVERGDREKRRGWIEIGPAPATFS